MANLIWTKDTNPRLRRLHLHSTGSHGVRYLIREENTKRSGPCFAVVMGHPDPWMDARCGCDQVQRFRTLDGAKEHAEVRNAAIMLGGDALAFLARRDQRGA